LLARKWTRRRWWPEFSRPIGPGSRPSPSGPATSYVGSGGEFRWIMAGDRCDTLSRASRAWRGRSRPDGKRLTICASGQPSGLLFRACLRIAIIIPSAPSEPPDGGAVGFWLLKSISFNRSDARWGWGRVVFTTPTLPFQPRRPDSLSTRRVPSPYSLEPRRRVASVPANLMGTVGNLIQTFCGWAGDGRREVLNGRCRIPGMRTLSFR